MKIHSFEWQCECGIKHNDIYAESVFPQECECGKTHYFKDIITAQLLLHTAYGSSSLLDLAKRLADYVRLTIENEKPKRIMSGEYSRDMWNAINSAETVEDLQDALYFVCCRLQELESSLTTNAPDAAERHTSFIELKCHKCGAIIDATLTQMPRR